MLKNILFLNKQRSFSTCLVKLSAERDKKDAYYKQRGNVVKEDGTRPANWNDAKPYGSIPGPMMFPIIGNGYLFSVGKYKGMDFSQISKTLYNEHGPVFKLKIPGRRDLVFISDAHDIEHLFRNEGMWPVRESILSIKYYRSNIRKDVFSDTPGLTAMHGEKWYKFRTLVNPILMQPKTAHNYVHNMDLVAHDFLKRIKQFQESNAEGEMPVDFENEVNKWALESIILLALDKRFGCLDENPGKEVQILIDSVVNVFELMYHLDILPSMWKIYATKDWKAFVKCMDTITFTFLRHIEMAQETIKKRIENDTSLDKSIFAKFLELDKKVAITMAMDMLTAGIDTTSKTLCAALYYLAKNKDAQDKLRKELMELMPTKDTPITKEILAKANYLKATIKETTRLAPIGIGNLRTLQNEMVLGGYQIPKDVDIISNNLMMCKQENHFSQGDRFYPDRFLRSTTDEMSFKNTHPFVFMPFGFGPRSCIGKRLANLELEVATAKIIRSYYLDWPHEDMTFSTTLLYGIADPLKLHMKPVMQ